MRTWIGHVLRLSLVVAIGVLAGLLLKPVPQTVAPAKAGPDVHHWSMPGGYRIAYRKVAAQPGVERRAPVIFLHGGPGGYVHSAVIRVLAPLAADGRDLYFYDQSGTGLSDRRARPKDTTVASHLADLETIRQRIGAERIVLIGHSFGGMLAALYAAEHPDRIDRLVLSSPGVLQPEQFDAEGHPLAIARHPVPADLHFTPPADYAQATSASRMPLRAMAAFTIAQLFDVKPVPDREMDDAINTLASGFTASMVCDPRHVKPEEGGAGAYSRVGTNFFPDDFSDRRPRMRRMPAPVLVLQGQCDFLDYADAYEYAALFPSATYRFVPNAGHILWWDRPDAYAAAIRGFLAAPDSAAATMPALPSTPAR